MISNKINGKGFEDIRINEKNENKMLPEFLYK
mgnify:CR=1 FL=1